MRKDRLVSRQRIIFLIPVLVGILFLWLALKPESVVKLQSNIEFLAKATLPPVPSLTPSPSAVVKKIITVTPEPSFQASPTPQTPLSSTPSPATSAQGNQTQEKLQVNLFVNNDSNLIVSVDANSNQCDVLSKALEQGKINSLNMKYEETFKSYAVYQINGVGKENSVWWVFKVNGQFPNQGCSLIKARSGDNIKWEYIGS